MYKILFVLFLSFSFGSQISFAQEYKPLRIEYDLKDFDRLRLIPAHPERIIAFKHYEKKNSKGDSWQMDGLNEKLEVVWSKNIMIPRSYELMEYELANDSILHLFVTKEKGESASFLKIRLNIKNGHFSQYQFKGHRRSLLVGLKIYNGDLYLYGIGLEYMKEQIDAFNASTKHEKVVSTIVPPQYYIISAMADTANQRFVMIVKNKKSANGEIRLLEFDNSGEITKSPILRQSEERHILEGKLVYSEESELIFIGTYSNLNYRKSSDSENPAYGVFIGKIEGNMFDFFQFYRFTEFNNIHKTLNFSEQQRIKNMQVKGKPVELSFNLLLHDKILKKDGQFILVAESYFPVYHFEPMYDGRGYMYQTEVFDGYRTTYGLTAAFDKEGKLVWDNYMKVNDIMNFYLDNNVTVYNDQESQVFMYYQNEKIHSKVTQGNSTVFKSEATQLKTVGSKDQVLNEDYGSITHWHSTYFLISGSQKISNLGGKNRKVFFIMGVSFE